MRDRCRDHRACCGGEGRSYGLSVCLIEGNLPGGLIANVETVEGFPAPESLTGAQIASSLLDRLRAYQVGMANHLVRGLHSPIAGHSTVFTTEHEITATRVVIATGARQMRGYHSVLFVMQDFLGIKQWWSVGAMGRCRRLCISLNKALVHRRQRFRARQRYIEQALESPRLFFKWQSAIADIQGK